MTYNVFGGTLSLTQSINQSSSSYKDIKEISTDINCTAVICLLVVDRDQERQQGRCFHFAANTDDCCASE